jgi:ornithine cyclodeaminase
MRKGFGEVFSADRCGADGRTPCAPTSAPAAPGDLAILGTGVQARSHLAAMRTARELRRVRVYSRDAERRRAFARAESERHGLEVEAAPTAAAAVAGADLVCTVTSSREPVLMGEWLSPGVHVNAAGLKALRRGHFISR